MMEGHVLNLLSLLTARVKLEELPEGIEMFRSGENNESYSTSFINS